MPTVSLLPAATDIVAAPGATDMLITPSVMTSTTKMTAPEEVPQGTRKSGSVTTTTRHLCRLPPLGANLASSSAW